MIDTKLSILSLGVLVIGLVIILALVGVAILFARSGRRRSSVGASMPVDVPSGVSLEARRDAREAVLQKLASKELTREQAETQLAELDNPVPEALPTPQARRGMGGAGCGCLVAVLVGVLVLVALGVFLSFFSVRRARVTSEDMCRQAQAAGVEAHRHSMATDSEQRGITARPSVELIEQVNETGILMPKTIHNEGVER